MQFRSSNLTLDHIQDTTDNIIQAQKKYLKKVDFFILVVNLVMMTLVATMSICYVFDSKYFIYNSMYPFILTIIFAELFFSVLSMRSTMKQIAYAFPNERLMCIHFINFPIWILLITIETILGMISGYMDNEMSTASIA